MGQGLSPEIKIKEEEIERPLGLEDIEIRHHISSPSNLQTGLIGFVWFLKLQLQGTRESRSSGACFLHGGENTNTKPVPPGAT